MRGRRVLDFLVGEGSHVSKVDFAPEVSARCACEEHMVPVFHSRRAALALVVVHNVLGAEVGSRAQPVFEVQPGEDFNFVGNTGLLDATPVHIT